MNELKKIDEIENTDFDKTNDDFYELVDLRIIDDVSYVYGRFANLFIDSNFDKENIPLWIVLAYQKQLEKLYKKKNKEAIRLAKKRIRNEKILLKKSKKV